MMIKKTPWLLAAAASLISGWQPAAANTANHESEWDKVALCDNLTVAGDSAEQWGCWNEFAPTAAGPADNIGLLGLPGSDPYTPQSQVELAGCASGTTCGYVAYMNHQTTLDNNGVQSGGVGYDPAVATLTETVEGGGTRRLHDWQLTAMAGQPAQPASGELDQVLPDSVFARLNEQHGADSGHIETAAVHEVSRDAASQTSIGAMEVRVLDYVASPDGVLSEYGRVTLAVNGTLAAGMWGSVTPVADLDGLRSANLAAYYFGHDITVLNDAIATGNTFAMRVNFGPGTWSGAWNPNPALDYAGGALPATLGDGTLTAMLPDSTGRLNLIGQVGFNAAGIVIGPNFRSTSVSAPDGQVTGTVSGSFFGPQAAAIGGVAAITKTKAVSTTNIPYTSARYVTPFVSTSRQVASP